MKGRCCLMSLTKEQAKQDKAWNRAITKAGKEAEVKHEEMVRRAKVRAKAKTTDKNKDKK